MMTLPRAFRASLKDLLGAGHTHAEIASAIAKMAPGEHRGRPPRIASTTVDYIRSMFKAGTPARVLAEQLGIDKSHVRRILAGKARRVR